MCAHQEDDHAVASKDDDVGHQEDDKQGGLYVSQTVQALDDEESDRDLGAVHASRITQEGRRKRRLMDSKTKRLNHTLSHIDTYLLYVCVCVCVCVCKWMVFVYGVCGWCVWRCM